jgi:plastocyanin
MRSNDHFYPGVVVIEVGRTVEWTNDSEVAHDVTNDPARAVRGEDVRTPPGMLPFDSRDVAPARSFRHTFAAEGEVRYVCTLHERSGMKGVVPVQRTGVK